jgi:septal ring factor EnvC (AmiA/AmiB activator)
MNSDLQKLIELEKVDREIARLNDEVATLPKRVAAIESKLADDKAAVERAKAAIKTNEAARRKLEADIQGFQQKIVNCPGVGRKRIENGGIRLEGRIGRCRKRKSRGAYAHRGR